ncbi:MAG TPA: cobalamin biosynthesis protein [Candidatus Methanofastidiosa archaeon]|nr:cobalamin biosynthesis protein [Candidatus Methanofastidiosa archaeon]
MIRMDEIVLFFIPALALLYDMLIGERPLYLHPVMAYGKVISLFDKHFGEGHSKNISRLYGLALLSVLGLLSALPVLALGLIFKNYGTDPIVYVLTMIMSIYLLKTSFSMRHMVHEAREVCRYVKDRDIDGARHRVSYIVSRNTENLGFEDILSADVECVSESFVDSIFSPMFYFLLFGLYGCQFYRAMNSADSRVGYMTERYRDFGLIPARFDDLLNFIPARLAVIVTLVSGMLLRQDVRGGWRTYRKYANATQSPNAGQTMATYSGLLRVRLHKPGHYDIGNEFESPRPQDVEKAIDIYVLSTFISIVLVILAFMTPLLPMIFI